MTELRREPITRMWVVITTDHPKGPSDYLSFKPPYRLQESEGPCPFCPGNEKMTPRETFSIRREGGRWAVRVVPNKFPFFRIEGNFDRRPEGMYDLMEAIGAHEIVIESPEHHENLATLETHQIEKILLAYRERLVDLEGDHRFQQFLIIKNYPGIFNRHPHSHLMALPVIPKRIDEEIWGTLDYFQRKERCIYCDIIKEEISLRKRVVLETAYFLVFSPFASRFPFETWIIPKVHCSDFHTVDQERMADLSGAIRSLFHRFSQLLSDPPYSLTFHTSPVQSQFHRPEYHWHIETRLRVGLREGFEWGTGFFVNPTPPENAAAYLRGVE
ncbi:MAG: galactose-1-phosphate uridylyltransferase [Deltaproteobacteria bacterium RBG_16_48_10]|nr:MAG: galactose-1-phosphate uridylyltransferase [Deltaproteobacteria bacterium RBG_16_48_10]